MADWKCGDVITNKGRSEAGFPNLTVISNEDGYIKAEHYGWGGTHGYQRNLEKYGFYKINAEPAQ